MLFHLHKQDFNERYVGLYAMQNKRTPLQIWEFAITV